MTTMVDGSVGSRLALDRFGDGEPVVFVHGSSGGLSSWDPVTAELREEFTVITYARSAYPPSRRGSRPMTFAAEVDDLFAVVEATGARRAHLVGGSYGATVALYAAVDARAAWRSVTVFEPPLFAAGSALRSVLERYRLAVEHRRYAAAAWMFGAEVARMPVEIIGEQPDDVTDIQVSDASAEALAKGCVADLEAMASDTSDIDTWSHIAAPLLLMQGELTWQPMPDTMAALRRVLPQSADHVVLRGHSHFAPHTAPQEFAAELRAFFERHSTL